MTCMTSLNPLGRLLLTYIDGVFKRICHLAFTHSFTVDCHVNVRFNQSQFCNLIWCDDVVRDI